MFVIEIVHRHDPPSRHYVYESLYNARAGFLSRIGVTISFYSQTRHKQETCRAEDTEQANDEWRRERDRRVFEVRCR